MWPGPGLNLDVTCVSACVVLGTSEPDLAMVEKSDESWGESCKTGANAN